MALHDTIGFRPVAAALGGNALVTAIKFFAAFTSGSIVMFSEAIHSLADTVNQLLLLIGLRRSLKKATPAYEYGYGNERFFWALISACGIFFLGACITGYKGILALMQPPSIEFGFVIIPVLLVSLVVESYTFRIAARQLRVSFPDASWWERMKRADSSTLAVYLEDAVAVCGVLIAALSLVLSYYTGSSAWDAAGSIVISVLLAGVAVGLIAKNRVYLIGRSMPADLQEEVVAFLTKDPAIEKVIDFKSTVLGFGTYRIKCEIEFNGSALLKERYQKRYMEERYEEVRDDYEAFKRFCVDYADRIPRLMGKKIDEVEAHLKKRFPGVRHIDIEIN